MAENIRCCIGGGQKTWKSFKPFGTRVLLRKLRASLERSSDGIIIPESVNSNCSLGVAQVVELGDADQVRDSCLEVGDYVLYDYWSVYNDQTQHVITNVQNIVMKLTPEEASEYASGHDIFANTRL